ncbi:hypothetical protein TRVA0_038S00562 [Trichomonascus vanleenenianus]|uniref:Zds1p n=1 Tax=Trichomonascus vanleenenianus TaxID=2268995 RepID=UPI003EC9BD9E
MSEKELPPLPAAEAEQGYELDLDEYYYGSAKSRRNSGGPQGTGGGYLNESASHSAEAAAIVQQEMNNVQALKRLSIGALPTLDPDLPQPLPWEDEFQFEQAEETTDHLEKTSRSNGGGDSKQPLSVVSQDHASELLWVPAHVHPEIAPQEWKSFVQNKVAEIRAATVSNLEEQNSESTGSTGGSSGSSSGGGLSRRNSRLSRQITQDEFRDGSEILQRRSSQDSTQSILSLSNQLQQLGELESLAMDPFQLARSLTQVYRHSSLSDQRSMQLSTGESSDGEETNKESNERGSNRRSMSLSATKNPLSNDSDEPILAAPSSSLRRATRNRYSKGSIRTRPRRKVGSGLSAVSLDDAKPGDADSTRESDDSTSPELDSPQSLESGKENIEPEIPQRSKSRTQQHILEVQKKHGESNYNNISKPKQTDQTDQTDKQDKPEQDDREEHPSHGGSDHKEPSRYHHKKRPQEVAGPPRDAKIASPSLLSSSDSMPILPLASQNTAKAPLDKKRPPPITLTPPPNDDEEKSSVPTPPQSPRVKKKGTWGWLFSNDKDKEKELQSTTTTPITTHTNDTPTNHASHQSQLSVASSGKPAQTSPTSPTKSSVDKLLNRSEEDDPAPSVTKSFSAMFSKKKKKDDDDPRKKKAAKGSDKKKPSRYRNRKDHEAQAEPVGGVVVDASGTNDMFDTKHGGQQSLQQQQQQQQQQSQQIELPYHIPEHQMSDKSLVMMYHRYPLHIERAIYRLSHLKLANPRRPLVQQVLLSNFMYAYLNLINHGYQQQQQQLQQMQMYHQYTNQPQQQYAQEYEEPEEQASSSSSSSSSSPEELWHEFEAQEQQQQRYGYGTTAPIAS